MNDKAAQTVLLVKAVEENDPEGRILKLSERQEAGRAAAAALGEEALRLEDTGARAAAEEAFILRRAEILRGKLEEAYPAVGLLRSSLGSKPWGGLVIGFGAFLVGLFGQDAGSGQKINILAFPLLGLLLWNLAVYLFLIECWVREKMQGKHKSAEQSEGLERWVEFARRRRWGQTLQRIGEDRIVRALRQFGETWTALCWPLHQARLAWMLHFGTAFLVLGAIAGMYARGLGLEYKAGWESTFLDANGVHRLLSWVLGPASLFTGIPVASPQEIENLRGREENAAAWIHLYSATAALFILGPRAVLGWRRWREERELRHRFPFPPMEELYYRRLLAWGKGEGERVLVMPYSVTLNAPQKEALRSLAVDLLGARSRIDFCEGVPYGGEEEFLKEISSREEPPGECDLALFNMGSTPEMETQGRFVEGLLHLIREGRRGRHLLLVLDEAGFRRRFADGGEVESRHGERLRLWKRFASAFGMDVIPVNLDAPDSGRWLEQAQKQMRNGAGRECVS